MTPVIVDKHDTLVHCIMHENDLMLEQMQVVILMWDMKKTSRILKKTKRIVESSHVMAEKHIELKSV